MSELVVLGTGTSSVTKCYNTCFALGKNNDWFLVDAGGGNGILKQLKQANIPIGNIHNVFISHAHADHILGAIWIIRRTASLMSGNTYDGDLNIYCGPETAKTLEIIANLTIVPEFTQFIGTRIKIIPVENNEEIEVLGNKVKCINLNSKEGEQFGFITNWKDKKIAFLGDVPYDGKFDEELRSADFLLMEAFCLYADREKFKPYEKYHNTIKEPSEISEKLNAKNLVLWHMKDDNIENRKRLGEEEAKQFFSGNIFVPDDFDRISLDTQHK